jgi:RNA polymerase sigma factor (sigma-70 family)
MFQPSNPRYFQIRFFSHERPKKIRFLKILWNPHAILATIVMMLAVKDRTEGEVDEKSQDLVAQWRQGNQEAAGELFHRFAEKLIALAASRLSEKLARRLDPEDVVQSAYRSFFVGARDGRYVLERSGDLWRLLVQITLHKLYRQAERHTTKKRGLNKERVVAEDTSQAGVQAQAESPDPSPLEAAALADEVEHVIGQLEPQHRPILELRLQGYKLEEIAAEQGCSERTVRRVLESVRHLLEQDRESPQAP